MLSIVDISSVVAEDRIADDRQSMGSRTSLRPTSARRRRQAKLAYFQAITEPTVVGIEEVIMFTWIHEKWKMNRAEMILKVLIFD